MWVMHVKTDLRVNQGWWGDPAIRYSTVLLPPLVLESPEEEVVYPFLLLL